MELIDQIKKAYSCITGTGPDMSRTRSKKVSSKVSKIAETPRLININIGNKRENYSLSMCTRNRPNGA
jgi:hypothetical protein